MMMASQLNLLGGRMTKYAVHYVWVDLRSGDDYGSRASSVYPKAMKGLAASTPVGIWDEHGSFEYLNNHEPNAEVLRGWRLSLAKLGIDEWVKQLDERHGTWSDGWAVVESDLSSDLLLESLHFEFLAAHPPVTEVTAPSQVLEVGDGGDDAGDDLDEDELDVEHAADDFHPAMRYVIAQSWWIAAELVRRHPELIIHEMHPGGGMYDCLALLRPDTHEPFIQLNRVGSIQVDAAPEFRLTWAEAMSTQSPRLVVDEIEAVAGLRPPVEVAPTTPRVLAYQFIAAALATTVNDECVWDARNEFIDSSADWGLGDPEDLNGYLANFPEALRDLESTPRIGLWHEPESHFWALLRDGEPFALVSIEGVVYLRERRRSLLDESQDSPCATLIAVLESLAKQPQTRAWGAGR